MLQLIATAIVLGISGYASTRHEVDSNVLRLADELPEVGGDSQFTEVYGALARTTIYTSVLLQTEMVKEALKLGSLLAFCLAAGCRASGKDDSAALTMATGLAVAAFQHRAHACAIVAQERKHRSLSH